MWLKVHVCHLHHNLPIISSKVWSKWDCNVNRERDSFLIIRAINTDDIADQLLKIIHHQGTCVIDYCTCQILQSSCGGFNEAKYFMFTLTTLFHYKSGGKKINVYLLFFVFWVSLYLAFLITYITIIMTYIRV